MGWHAPVDITWAEGLCLGSAYVKLWAAASVSCVGDGIYYTALPLLAATITRDPLRVATVEVAGQLPWLPFVLALVAGPVITTRAIEVARAAEEKQASARRIAVR